MCIMSQDSINHHYVPQGLLKNWYVKDSKGKNQGFRKYQRKYNGEVSLFPNPCSSQSSCSEEHLNTLYKNVFSITDEVIEDTNTIEHSFHDLDTDGLVLINSVLEAPREKIFALNKEEKELLSKFVLSLHLRHPETIQHAQEQLEQKANSSLKFISEKLVEYDLGNRLDYFKKNINLTTMRRTLDEPESYKLFCDMDLVAVVFEDDFFFSGEKPLVLNFCKNEVIPSLGYAISLSPRVLLLGYHPKFLKEDFAKYQDFLNKFIVSYNGIVCEQSKYIIFSGEVSEELRKIYIEDALK